MAGKWKLVAIDEEDREKVYVQGSVKVCFPLSDAKGAPIACGIGKTKTSARAAALKASKAKRKTRRTRR